jgi:transcriptional regulator with XRE-family HTH domain
MVVAVLAALLRGVTQPRGGPAFRGSVAAVPAEPLGPLLARRRKALCKSQSRLADLLCGASGVPTVTRHEVSRWEREVRMPRPFWLHWLSVVLGLSLDELERAAAAGQQRRNRAAALPMAHIVRDDMLEEAYPAARDVAGLREPPCGPTVLDGSVTGESLPTRLSPSRYLSPSGTTD